METISLFSSINYARPRSHSEGALSTLSNYFYLGGNRATVVRGDEVRLKVGKVSWYTIALKVAAYVLLFPLTLILLTVNLILRYQHNFTIIRSSPINQSKDYRDPTIERDLEVNLKELATQNSDKDILEQLEDFYFSQKILAKDILVKNVAQPELFQKQKNNVDLVNAINSPADLPKDILLEIISYLNIKDIKNINLVNKQWHTFLNSNHQWILKNHMHDLNFKSALKLACLCGSSLEELDFRPIFHQQQYQKKMKT